MFNKNNIEGKKIFSKFDKKFDEKGAKADDFKKKNKNFLKYLDDNDLYYWFDIIKNWTIEQAAFLLSGYHPIMPYDDFDSYKIPFEVKKFLVTLIDAVLESQILNEEELFNDFDFFRKLYVKKTEIMRLILQDEELYHLVPTHESVKIDDDMLRRYVSE